MRLKILENREVLVDGSGGTQNENNAEQMIITSIPESVEEKSQVCLLVFITDSGIYTENIEKDPITNLLSYNINSYLTHFNDFNCYYVFLGNNFKFVTKTFKIDFNDNLCFLSGIPDDEMSNYLVKLETLDNTITNFSDTIDGLIDQTSSFETSENQRVQNELSRINQEEVRQNLYNDMSDLYEEINNKLINGEFDGTCQIATFDIIDGNLVMTKHNNSPFNFAIINNNLVVEV